MSVVLAVTFYELALIAHIAAAIVAFGVVFAYPVLLATGRRVSPAAMPALHRAQNRIGQVVVTPAATVVLLAGLYMASDRWDFSQSWISTGILIVVVLLGLGGAYFSPRERRLAELAERDIAASGDGEVAFSEEYERLSRQVAIAGAVTYALVIAAVWVMVTKPGI